MNEPAELEQERPRRSGAWIWLGFVGVLTLLAFGSPGREEDAEPLVYSYGFAAAAIIQAVILVIAASIIAYIYLAHDWRNTFGLRRFKRRDLGLAAAVVVASIVAGAALEPLLNAGDRQGIVAETWDSSRAVPFAINAVLIILLVPFVEELLFRGVGVRVLSVFGVAVAIGLSGLMFGLVHGIWEALPVLTLFGVGLGYVRYKSNSVFPAFIAHAVFNGVGLAASFAG